MGTLHGHYWIISESSDLEIMICTMDLCVAYADVPSHVSGHQCSIHFLLGTQRMIFGALVLDHLQSRRNVFASNIDSDD